MSKDSHFLFYTTTIREKVLMLDSGEVTHISQVLRFGEGDEITVSDGKGTLYQTQIVKLKRDSALCSIKTTEKIAPQDKKVKVYVGIPDKEKFDLLCEMLPPLGVSEIIPVITEFTQKSWWSKKWDKSLERCNRKVISSMKQSFNPYICKISEPIKFDDIINTISNSVFLFGDENGSLLSEVDEAVTESNDFSLFVGPPGGFSDGESEKLREVGAGVKLGSYRLRTELAAVSLASFVNQL
jgi:16S rRNA (uracil1498-N3)-methyltransferase